MIKARKQLGLNNQSDLATAAGVSLGVVGAVERGDRKVAASSLTKIESALGWEHGTADEILGGAPPPRAPVAAAEPAAEPDWLEHLGDEKAIEIVTNPDMIGTDLWIAALVELRNPATLEEAIQFGLDIRRKLEARAKRMAERDGPTVHSRTQVTSG